MDEALFGVYVITQHEVKTEDEKYSAKVLPKT